MPSVDTKNSALLVLKQMFENSWTYPSLFFLYSVAETGLNTQLCLTTWKLFSLCIFNRTRHKAGPLQRCIAPLQHKSRYFDYKEVNFSPLHLCFIMYSRFSRCRLRTNVVKLNSSVKRSQWKKQSNSLQQQQLRKKKVLSSFTLKSQKLILDHQSPKANGSKPCLQRQIFH